MIYKNEREEVAYFMRRLYTQNLTTCSGGNLSLKVDDNTVLITPSQLDKGRLTAEQIGVLTMDGENLTPELKTSMETWMHLAIYKKRGDVKAIVHAHPAIASSFAVSDKKKIKTCLTGEGRYLLGEPVFAPYKLMGTKDLAEVVSECSLKTNVILMENHGILTVGTDMLQAFNRLEVLEVAAKITLITEVLGNQKELEPHEVAKIDAMVG